MNERCTFDGTTASTAICTNSYNDDDNDLLITNSATTQDAFTTLTYDGKLASNQYGSEIVFPSFNGPPPFIPVKITAGLSSLSVLNAAVATGTSSISTSSQSTSQTASPTITSMPKGTGSTSSVSSSVSSGTTVAAGNTTTTTTKASSAQIVRARWEWCLAPILLLCVMW